MDVLLFTTASSLQHAFDVLMHFNSYVNVSRHDSKADNSELLWGQSFRTGKKIKAFLKGHFFPHELFTCNL